MSNRQVCLLNVGYILCLFGFAAYLQLVENLAPCPLCITQRVVFFALLVIAFTAAIHNPSQKGYKTYAVFSIVIGILGIAIASRHVWLQSLPPGMAPACGPSLDVMLENFPLLDVLKVVLTGNGDCALVDWTLLGLSLPLWSLLAFLLLTASNSFMFFRQKI